MNKIMFQINQLNCPSCGKDIEKELSILNGVKTVKVFSKLGKIRVEFNENLIGTKQIEKVLKNLNLEIAFNKE